MIEQNTEKAVFVGVVLEKGGERKTMEYLDELQFLAETAGAVGDKKFIQRLDQTYKATYKFVSKNATDTLDSKIVKLYREEYEAGTPDLKDKTEFTPKAITQTFSDTATGGTWKFKGWNPPKATVNGKDLEFTGTWELTK